MSARAPLSLFEAFGIELEYMIVDSSTLAVRPLADELLKEVGGGYDLEVELGEVAWSNELALHVIEMKTNGPRPSLAGLGAVFQQHVERMNARLSPMGARLLPSAMHPWMDPHSELRLWPHEANQVYRTFDRIFDCKGHGWANLQSMHVNLPFADDAEFARLHAAVRLVLPLLPGLAASSPFAEGRATGLADTRLDYYRGNARRVPSVTGHVVPERVFTRREYEEGLLGGIYRDLRPLDPEGVLAHEWVNARGAIARFDRGAIEIRLIDLQECPQADLAVAAAVIAVVRALVEQLGGDIESQKRWDEQRLAAMLFDAIRDGDDAVLGDREYLALFGYPGAPPVRLGELWRHLIDRTLAGTPEFAEFEAPLRLILDQGCLSRRLARAAGVSRYREGPAAPCERHRSAATGVAVTEERSRLAAVYHELAECLAEGRLFDAPRS